MKTVNCQRCGAAQAAAAEITWAACGACGAMVFRPSEGPRVLVAHESAPLAEEIGSVLLAAGFWPVRAEDGAEAVRLLDASRPAAAVVDVGLKPVLAFELVEHARKNPATADVRVVLVASVYNKTAYKRRPANLYGADDYVEQHHIHDMLPVKICKLLDIDPAGVAALVPVGNIEHGAGSHELSASQRAEQQRVRDAANAPRGGADDDGPVLATARSIVADIALYLQADVQAVVQGADLGRLAPALQEGRRVLETLIPRREWRSADPVMDAFHDFVEQMRRGGR